MKSRLQSHRNVGQKLCVSKDFFKLDEVTLVLSAGFRHNYLKHLTQVIQLKRQFEQILRKYTCTSEFKDS